MLSYTRRFLLVPSLLLLAVLGSSAAASEPKPTPKQIVQWVEQLGDNDFKVRENASKKLWQAGAAAEPALEKAVKSDDPEVVRRARDLLDKFRWGIYPDTPAGIVALIRAYQSSEGNPRMEVLKKLLDSGEAGLRAVLKIAAAEKDANQRKMLGDLVANKLPAAFLLAVAEGKHEPFERLLELGHEGKFVAPNQYAAYWLLRGQLAERIAHFSARLSEHPEDKWAAQTLAYLHRANGDLVAARKAAEKSDRADLLEGILYELGDWKALAARPDSTATEKLPAEKWAYRAAFARLAGKHKEFENAVRELRKFADGKEDSASQAFVAAKGLLLNDRPAEGLDLLRTQRVHEELLFEVLCARLDFPNALKLVDQFAPSDRKGPHVLEVLKARTLYLLGEKDKAKEMFARLGEQIKDGVSDGWVRKLIETEYRFGLRDEAFAHCAQLLSISVRGHEQMGKGQLPDIYLQYIFPDHTEAAVVWWEWSRSKFKEEPAAATMKRVRALLEGKHAPGQVKAWIEEIERVPPQPDPRLTPPAREAAQKQEHSRRRRALAEAALAAGLDEIAFNLLEKADSRDALLRLGDLLAAKKQWTKAAERYRQAWTEQLRPEAKGRGRPRRDRFQVSAGERLDDPLPLYLAGDALVRAGKEKEGKKLIEQAHWFPFANAATRYNFLSALTKRGHKEAARRETELLLRVSEPNTFYSGAAIRRYAVAALARRDYLKAAEGFEQSMLRCFNPYTNFVSNAAYANVPAQIHQLRASALLAAGKLDEALQHVALALADSPGYVDLPIALVPELERRGHKKEATDLFNRCYGAYEKVCRDYPRCAWAHNSAAWMSACCRRNLDQALQHAQKAVELAPTNAGYLDTLAEVHFQRGDKDKAVALQKRVVELDPKKTYFRKQLKRLEAGDPSAERPPENDEE